MVFASLLSLFLGYIACVLLCFRREDIVFSASAKVELENISDEEFVEYMDEYLEDGAEKLDNLHRRKIGIKVSESILAVYFLIFKYFL